MREMGWLLIVLGICLIGGSFLVTTSTHVGYTSYSIYAPSLPSEVSNLYGMHVQMALIVAGVGAILTGTVCVAADAIVAAIERLGVPLSKFETPPMSEQTPAADSEPVSIHDEPATEQPGDSISILIGSVFAIALLVLLILYSTSQSQGGGAFSANAVDAAANDAQNVADELDNAANAAEAAARNALR